ncbi:MAG: rhodanese-like domain-containing protein [Myxococcota bacterium]
MISAFIGAGVAIFVGLTLFRKAQMKAPSPEEARQLIEDGALLVDVRTPAEYARSHLEGAVNAPLGSLPADLPKDRLLLVYCAKGLRASRAESVLKKQGYTQIRSIGSAASWPL